MKLYLANTVFYGTQAEAKKADKNFVQVEVPTDKEGLIGYLNANYAHADVDFDDLNADRVVKDVNEDIRPELAPRERPYTELSTNLDELFAGAPLAHRLTLASLALEDARDLCPVLIAEQCVLVDEVLAEIIAEEAAEELDPFA